MDPAISVLKFGSSVLTHPDRLTAVVHDVYREYRERRQVIVVVSAIGRHTDSLLAEAHRLTAKPYPDHAVASLLATGEKQSAALLTIALDRAGIPCRLLEPALLNLTLRGERLDGEPVSVDTHYIQSVLHETPVIVVPGFIGTSSSGELALMGRGGSDLTAVFLADRMRASHCRLVKDVDAIYEYDPADAESNDARPQRFDVVTYEDAMRVSEGLIQPKAIAYLRKQRQQATVAALHHRHGTIIGTSHSNLKEALRSPPLRVLLLGLGNVGRGVFEHCKRLEDHVEIVGIGVRNRAKHACHEIPQSLLHDDIDKLLDRPHDIVIELTGDPGIAEPLIARSLRLGRGVITASKEVLSGRLSAFAELAESSGAALAYSAAVGGGVPMLETVRAAIRQGSVCRLRGVLNGTCNYVLDRLLEGDTMARAVRDAKRLGFAEADPANDLSGRDSEHKLRILAQAVFGTDAADMPVTCNGIADVASDIIDNAREQGRQLRLVATANADGVASVVLEPLAPGDPLAGARGEENRLLLEFDNGDEWLVKGRGAGRWPSAESVIADLLDMHEQLSVPVPACRSKAANVL